MGLIDIENSVILGYFSLNFIVLGIFFQGFVLVVLSLDFIKVTIGLNFIVLSGVWVFCFFLLVIKDSIGSGKV